MRNQLLRVDERGTVSYYLNIDAKDMVRAIGEESLFRGLQVERQSLRFAEVSDVQQEEEDEVGADTGSC